MVSRIASGGSGCHCGGYGAQDVKSFGQHAGYRGWSIRALGKPVADDAGGVMRRHRSRGWIRGVSCNSGSIALLVAVASDVVGGSAGYIGGATAAPSQVFVNRARVSCTPSPCHPYVCRVPADPRLRLPGRDELPGTQLHDRAL